VLKGGRYDKLIGSFGRDLPAVGFGVNVDMVARHLSRIGANPEIKPVDAIVYGEKGFVVEAIAYSQKLVREGAKVENSLFNTYEETVDYAKKTGVAKIIRVGEEITEIDL
jgi:ATP phosphoribosyltransferase regulatory subunit